MQGAPHRLLGETKCKNEKKITNEKIEIPHRIIESNQISTSAALDSRLFPFAPPFGDFGIFRFSHYFDSVCIQRRPHCRGERALSTLMHYVAGRVCLRSQRAPVLSSPRSMSLRRGRVFSFSIQPQWPHTHTQHTPHRHRIGIGYCNRIIARCAQHQSNFIILSKYPKKLIARQQSK